MQNAECRMQNPASRTAHLESRPTPHVSRFTFHVSRSLSIADLLESTVEEAIAFLSGFPDSRPADRAVESLKLLEEVGLGYLRLGQPINTLSGGESQRLKLVRHLAEAIVAADGNRSASKPEIRGPKSEGSQSLLTGVLPNSKDGTIY